MKVLKYSLKTMMVLSICCFILICAVKIVKGVFMKQPVAHVFGYAVIPVAPGAGSMYVEGDEDSLAPNDKFLIKRQKSYEVGDVITFSDSIGIVTHRIVGVTEEGYITKGDNPANSIDSEIVTPDKVQGKMMGKKLNGFEAFLLSTWGMLTIMAIFTGGYMATNLDDYAGRKETNN